MALMIADNMSVQEQAALWIVHLTSDSITEEDQKEFQAWLNKDRSHEKEYQRAKHLWAGLEGAQDLADLASPPSIPTPASQPADKRPAFPNSFSQYKEIGSQYKGIGRRLVGSAAAVLFLVTAYILFLHTPSPFSNATVHATAISEIRDIRLPDGSRVTLGAKSTLHTDFTEQERRVTLNKGEAFFAVEKDPTRPFIVVAGDTRVRVMGTKFDMRHGVKEVKVTVLEGIVEVDSLAASTGISPPSESDTISAVTAKDLAPTSLLPQKRTLTAGQEIVTAPHGPSILRELHPEKIAPWRSGRLVYADEALREVVADANRYYKGEIRLASDELGALRITASFRSEQIEQMIRSLVTAYELEVDHHMGQTILRRKKDAS